MKRRAYIAIFLAVIVLGPAGSPLAADDDQGWINNSLSFKIDNTFTLKFTNETRYNEITYSDTFMRNWQGGIACKLSKSLYVALLFKREDTRKKSFLLHENRFTLEGGWKTGLGKKAVFDIRFRTEIRGFEEELAENHLRFRLRARLKCKWKIGQLKLDPFIAIEPFGDTLENEIFRYRVYAGFVFPMGKHAGFVINYIRQGTRDKESVNILNTGVELKF